MPWKTIHSHKLLPLKGAYLDDTTGIVDINDAAVIFDPTSITLKPRHEQQVEELDISEDKESERDVVNTDGKISKVQANAVAPADARDLLKLQEIDDTEIIAVEVDIHALTPEIRDISEPQEVPSTSGDAGLSKEKESTMDIGVTEVIIGEVDVYALTPGICEVQGPHVSPAVVDEPEILMDKESATMDIDDTGVAVGEVNVYTSPQVTRDVSEPQMASTAVSEPDFSTDKENTVDIEVTEVIAHEVDIGTLASTTRKVPRISLVDEGEVLTRRKVLTNTDGTEVTILFDANDLTPEALEVSEQQLLPMVDDEVDVDSIRQEAQQVLEPQRPTLVTDEVAASKASGIDEAIGATSSVEIEYVNKKVEEPPEQRQLLQTNEGDVEVMAHENGTDSVASYNKLTSTDTEDEESTLFVANHGIENSDFAKTEEPVKIVANVTDEPISFNDEGSPEASPIKTKLEQIPDTDIIGSALPIRIQDDRLVPMPSTRFSTPPFLAKTWAKEPAKNVNSLCSDNELLFRVFDDSELSAWKSRLSGERHVRFAALDKAGVLARAALRHFTAFLIGVDGKYKNQIMIDSLFAVWTSRSWA